MTSSMDTEGVRETGISLPHLRSGIFTLRNFIFLLGVNTVIYFATGSDIGSLISGNRPKPSAEAGLRAVLQHLGDRPAHPPRGSQDSDPCHRDAPRAPCPDAPTPCQRS